MHLVFVYSNNNLSIYSNSILVGSHNVEPLAGNIGYHNFGASLTGTDQFLTGSLDDIGIWDRELTPIEISNLCYYGQSEVYELVSNKSFILFPNPSHDILNLKVNTNLIGSIYTILDNIGRIAKTGEINTENYVVELDGLNEGMYSFHIGEKTNHTLKFVKQ